MGSPPIEPLNLHGILDQNSHRLYRFLPIVRIARRTGVASFGHTVYPANITSTFGGRRVAGSYRGWVTYKATANLDRTTFNQPQHASNAVQLVQIKTNCNYNHPFKLQCTPRSHSKQQSSSWRERRVSRGGVRVKMTTSGGESN